VVRVGVIGATGYAGQELVRILVQHPNVEVASLASHSYAGKKFSAVYPAFKDVTDLVCQEEDFDKLAKDVEILFFALPHKLAAEKMSDALLKNVRVIDLGSDFRLHDPSSYDSYYGFNHPSPQFLKQSVYGLCELHRREIASARLVASPGCYATTSILALAPLLKHNLVESNSLIVDAKSGVSGAGRGLALGMHFDECNETVKAYKVASHRHTPEIEQELSGLKGLPVNISFTPHLIPMNRGIFVTAYASIRSGLNENDIWSAYKNDYGQEPFVRLYEPDASSDYQFPETRWVKGSNYCDIGLKVDTRTNRVIVIAALDNLVKGAAGQGVQSLNIMCGFDETLGLKQLPIFPA
jgi:N-acetyl-gamma-glutamyl-phosphate reductase